MTPLTHPVLCAMLSEDDIAEMPMLQSTGLSLGGKAFCFQSAAGLVLKLPAAEVERLVADGQGAAFVVGKRVMRCWITLAPDYPDDGLAPLLRLARDFTRTSKEKRNPPRKPKSA